MNFGFSPECCQAFKLFSLYGKNSVWRTQGQINLIYEHVYTYSIKTKTKRFAQLSPVQSNKSQTNSWKINKIFFLIFIPYYPRVMRYPYPLPPLTLTVHILINFPRKTEWSRVLNVKNAFRYSLAAPIHLISNKSSQSCKTVLCQIH